MEYYIAVFRSRTEAFSYTNVLKYNRIDSSLIPTPKESGRTCGLSVKVFREDFEYAKFLLSNLRTQSFSGWYFCSEKGDNRIVVRA